MSTTGNGRLPIRKRITGHRAAPHTGNRRRDDDGPPEEGRRWNETLSSAAVILAGVLVVVGFGLFASRAMRSHSDAPNVSVPQAPALGDVGVCDGEFAADMAWERGRVSRRCSSPAICP